MAGEARTHSVEVAAPFGYRQRLLIRRLIDNGPIPEDSLDISDRYSMRRLKQRRVVYVSGGAWRLAHRDSCPRCGWHKPPMDVLCEECTIYIEGVGERGEELFKAMKEQLSDGSG
jgi:hypothetical protein